MLKDKTIVELLIGGSGGGSKSYTMALMMAITCREYPGARLLLGRKTLKSLRQSTLNTLLTQVHRDLGVNTNDFTMQWQTGELHYKNGSMIILSELDKAPSDPDFARLGSLEIDMAFIDEAGEITLQAKNAIRSRTGRGVLAKEHGIPGKIIASCNPSQNFLRDEYYSPYAKLGGGESQKWSIGQTDIDGERRDIYRAFLRISVYDNPFMPGSYIDTLKSLPDRERKRLLDGDWNYADDSDSLFQSLLLDKATAYEVPEPEDGFNKYIGVDVADKGKDKTIATLIDTGVLVTQKALDLHMSEAEMKSTDKPLSYLYANELIKFAQQNGFTAKQAKNIAIEGNGIGVGLRDAMRIRGWYISLYEATSKSRSEGYYNFYLDLDAGSVKILYGLDDGELRRQLSAHTYEMVDQKPKVKKKDKLKLDLGCSPDYADSAMISNWCRRGATSGSSKKNQNRIRW